MTDPLQTSALNALAPFLALAPSATSPRAAADLISQAVAAPGTYVFAELLATPNVQALNSAEAQYQQWIRVLEIFCWGTWSDYTSHQQSAPAQALPALNAQQQHKLRLLTLLTLSHIPSALNYATLATSLGLRSTSELEPLLIQAISSGLLSGRLNPASSRLDVRSVAPLRDLAPGSLVALAGVLGAWEQRCAQVLAEVEMQIESTRRKAQARGRAEAEWDKMIDERVGVPRLGKQTRAAGGTDDDLAKGGKRDRGDDGSGSDAKRGGKFAAGGRRSSAARP